MQPAFLDKISTKLFWWSYLATQRWVSADHAAFLMWQYGQLGLTATLASFARMLGNPRELVLDSRLTPYPVCLRPGSADYKVFDQVYVVHDYALELGAPSFILDAGAHIGLASAFFAARYPRATVVALEPEPSNFGLLVKNVARFPNVHPIQAGLWSRRAHLAISNPGDETWAFRVEEADDGIPALSVEDILDRFKADHIDVLKMDIEGSEVQVLRHTGAWLPKVGTLIIELHDRFSPGCSAALEQAITGQDFVRTQSGENVVLSRARR